MDDISCDICGDSQNERFTINLKCNHCFHYDCIMKSFQYDKYKYNKCPLCRQSHGLLPIVNGLPKLIRGIHYIGTIPQDYIEVRCCELLKSGKRKGLPCGSKCIIGSTVCKRHHQTNLTKKGKQLTIKKLGDSLESEQTTPSTSV